MLIIERIKKESREKIIFTIQPLNDILPANYVRLCYEKDVSRPKIWSSHYSCCFC